MANTIWSKFYWSDWANDPALKLCSFAAQGLWMRMLCVAAEATPTGYVAVGGNALDETGIARLTGASLSEVANLLGELERNGVFSRDRHHRIYSRRMIADAKRRAIAVKNGKNGGNPTLRKQIANSSPDKGADNGLDNTQEPEAKSQKNIEPLAQQPIAPRAAAPNRYDDLLDKLLAANGISGFRAERSVGLNVVGEILGLLDAGYDLDRDILPVIRAKPNPAARTWGYFVPQIREAAERRSKAAASPKPTAPTFDWSAALEVYRSGTPWPHGWGPEPGTPGCRVPAALLVNFHRERAA